MHLITVSMFDLFLWAFQIGKHGLVMTKRLFYIEDIRICISPPEMILNTDHFMLLFIKMFTMKDVLNIGVIGDSGSCHIVASD